MPVPLVEEYAPFISQPEHQICTLLWFSFYFKRTIVHNQHVVEMTFTYLLDHGFPNSLTFLIQLNYLLSFLQITEVWQIPKLLTPCKIQQHVCTVSITLLIWLSLIAQIRQLVHRSFVRWQYHLLCCKLFILKPMSCQINNTIVFSSIWSMNVFEWFFS